MVAGWAGAAGLARPAGPRAGHTLAVPPIVFAAGAYGFGAAVVPLRGGAAIACVVGLAVLAAVLAVRRRVLAVFPLLLAFVASGAATAGLRRDPEESLTVRLEEAARASSTAAGVKTSTAAGRDPRVPVLIEGFVVEAPERSAELVHLVIDAVGVAPRVLTPLVAAQGRVRLAIPRAHTSTVAPGDRVRVLAKLRVPEPPLFPGDTGEDARLHARGIALLASASGGEDLAVIAPGERGGIGIAMERLRDAVHRGIDRHLDPRVDPRGDPSAASIVRAFATGDRSGIPRALEDDFARSGLAHLLAVSGLNLAIVAGLFLVLLERIFRRVDRVALGFGARRLAALFAIPFVVLYTLLVGASPSAVRAAVMVLVLLAAHLASRLRDPRAALAAAVLAMVAGDPHTLGDVSFQLSFAAVLALILLYPALRDRLAPNLERRPALLRWPLEVALASLAATLGTAPLVARAFERLSLAGLLANVPAHPLSTLALVPLALAGGLLSTVSDTLAHPLLVACGFASKGLAAIAAFSAALPFASVHVPRPSVVECALFYLVVIALTRARPRGRIVAFAAFAALSLEVAASAALRDTHTLRAAILPVGQGDAAVIELPGGQVLMIDAGPPAPGESANAAERVILPYLAERRIRRVDRLILTHPHVDHTGGLAALAKAIDIGEIWWTGDPREGPPKLREALQRLGARIVDAPRPRESLPGGAELEVLAPIVPAEDQPIVNDGSIVVRLSYGRRALLFTGDAERAEEEAMLDRCAACLRADVLKAGHHGSKTSSSEAFLDVVKPEHAILSLGRSNRFGFPHQVVTDRLRARNIRAYRTDREGAVIVETDGEDLTVTPFR